MCDTLRITKPLLGLFIVASSVNQLEETQLRVLLQVKPTGQWFSHLGTRQTHPSACRPPPPRFLDPQVRGGAWKPALLTRSQVMADAAGGGHALRAPGVSRVSTVAARRRHRES